MSTGAVLAIDVGTSMVKAVRVTADGAGRQVASRSAPGGDPGVDAEAVWETCAAVIRELTDSLGPQDGIDAVVVTGQGDGLWTLQRDGAPGTAYPWNRAVAGAVVQEWEADGTIAEHFAATGTVLWPGTAAALWRWLRRTCPEQAEQVSTVFCAKDWVGYRLCGEIATDVTDATIPFLDPRTRRYDPAALERLGCTDLAERLAPVAPTGSRLGAVTTEAARSTGVAAGTPVHVGCLDVVAMIRGAGLQDLGDSIAVLGTTAVAMSIVAEPVPDGEPSGATIVLPEEGHYLRVMGSNSGTSTLEWYLRTMQYTGSDRYDRFWADVAAATEGAEVFLPYLAGERAPFLAPEATGVFLGLTPTTTAAALSRSVAHGLTMALRHNLDTGQDAAAELVLTGGGSSAPQWCQLVADVTGRAVVVDERPDIGALGAASVLPGLSDLGRRTAGERTRYEPSSASAELQSAYRQFIDLIPQFRPIWRRTSGQPGTPQ